MIHRVEFCTTADCDRVAVRDVWVDEADPPDDYPYCESCAETIEHKIDSEPVSPDDPIVHGLQWRRERDQARAEVTWLREALDIAIYYATNLERVRNHLPVRDLGESHAAYVGVKHTFRDAEEQRA
jgi:hypothetical protein